MQDSGAVAALHLMPLRNKDNPPLKLTELRFSTAFPFTRAARNRPKGAGKGVREGGSTRSKVDWKSESRKHVQSVIQK